MTTIIIIFSLTFLIVVSLIIYEYVKDIFDIVIETNDFLDEFERRPENKDKP